MNPYHLKFAVLFFVQTLSRGILLSVIPLHALSIMGDAQSTSALFFAVSVGGILAALGMPFLIRRTGVHRAFLIGSSAMLLSSYLLSFGDSFYFAVGLFCHIFSIAAIEVCFSLYVLTQIPRRDLTLFEPLRIFSSVLALTIGPFLGVWMEQTIHHSAPFIFSALFVLFSLLYFHWFGLHKVVAAKSRTKEANPIEYIRRFIIQPRLRLAYGLVFARSCWWTMFVIYVPIYAVQSGLGEITGAGIVSLGTAWTLSVPFWGWIGRKYGVKKLFTTGYVATSLLTILIYAFSAAPSVASILIVISALGATILDGMGNVLFFRAVRQREQSEMTAVFATYRDLGQLSTPGLFAFLLSYFALPVVFLSASIWMLIGSWYCKYIPKRMN